MAIKTKYRLKNSNGIYDVVHFETSADLVITNKDRQFVTEQEKEQINKVNYHVHTQISASSTWEINHNLDKFPSVSIVDSAGSVVIGDVKHIDQNNVQINFTSGFAGKAYLN